MAQDESAAAATGRRLSVEIHGAVQGVGFRPFVYRLATELGLSGWVVNDTRGVFIEVEGAQRDLERFLARLPAETPPRALVQSIESAWLPAAGYERFEIRHSDSSGAKTVLVLPDIATCPDCLADLMRPGDRRQGYPFTNCTNCGPRFTIIRALPYDRPNTTMRGFLMCEACGAEYEQPLDRRFHAQPNACPECGPQAWFVTREELGREGARAKRGLPLDHEGSRYGGAKRIEAHEARIHEARSHEGAAGGNGDWLERTAEALRTGRIVAVKGLGGFHLMVDARNAEAVARLRERKRRGDKPFAVMAPDLAWVIAHCEVAAEAELLLTSAEAPIVLLARRRHHGEEHPERSDREGAESKDATSARATAPHPSASLRSAQDAPLLSVKGAVGATSLIAADGVADEVAPGNPALGVMLPYTPLHHLLMCRLGFPVVATSGNLTDEPICIDNEEAAARLGHIADAYLFHDRPIERHVDDSVAWISAGAPRLLRRARGYAPLPVMLPEEAPTLLAVGAHLKNTVALSVGRQVFISQHIGDLETPEAMGAFERVISDFLRLYEAQPVAIAHDLHPDYLSTEWARGQHLPLIAVQHHHAHLAACLAENGFEGRALGITWDGTGYGTDGTVWGGEFLLGDAAGFKRAAHLRPFRLPGGDAAVHEPRRAALALLWELYGEAALKMHLSPIQAFGPAERRLIFQMLDRRVHAPLTSSAGRLFDAVASLAGLRQEVDYEGQAAMQLEFAADHGENGAYPLELRGSSPIVLDWEQLVRAVVDDVGRGVSIGVISARFHNALVDAILGVASAIGEETVALSGGCFQNRLLVERAAKRLALAGHRVLLHRQVPANDGGISLGQIAVAAARGA